MPKQLFPMICAALALFVPAGFAQAPAAAPAQGAPAFEVATIKPAAPPNPQMIMQGKLHVGMKVDAAMVDIGFMSLHELICTAYRIKPHQLSGPAWMNTERFDIMAKLPTGASKDQVPEMLQSLLAERFKLAIHRETKESPVYALVVGKNGPKLKEAPPDPATPAAAAEPAGGNGGGRSFTAGDAQVRITGSGENTGAVITGTKNGTTKVSMGPGGVMHMEASKVSMASFAEMLTRFAGRPVVDETGLKGNYQIALDLSMADLLNVARNAGMAVPGMPAGNAGSENTPVASDPSGSGSVFAAVQQMGLKLEPKKAAVETVVVDRLEKAPTEN